MKEIKFRPLRRNKKTGKVIVASYMGWRKVMCADYGKFNLVVNDEYKTFSPDEFVHDHKGELLFWYKLMPSDISFLDSDGIVDFDDKMDFVDAVHRTHKNFAWKSETRDYYICRGLDVEGVPVFNHNTAEYIARMERDPSDFEPLTVKTVRHWFGWFLYQLKNSYLQIGK